MPLNLRLAYEKTGRVRFASHLDMMRIFARAFARADMPLRFTEGFNPHAYVSIALPLPVGMESLCERLDVGVTESLDLHALPERLNRVLPEGLRVVKGVMAGRPFAQIAFVRYDIKADSQGTPEQVLVRFRSEAVVNKRTKKKDHVPTDIVPLIRDVECVRDGDELRLLATVAAQNPSLNPEYIAEAWRTYLDPEACFAFKRVALLDGDGEMFDGL